MSNEVVLETALQWRKQGISIPKLIFVVITLENESDLFNLFGLQSIPSLVYLPQRHAIGEVVHTGSYQE